jgi:hypothetical protein
MIEKRTMAIVESSHRVSPILAIYDTEKQEVVCYRYIKEDDDDDEDYEWYNNSQYDRYFNTLQEAKEYVAKRQEYLRSKFSEVLEFIREMDRVDKEFFKFDKKEYLGHYVDSDYNDWMRKQCDKYQAENTILRSIARSRHFNLNGETINIDEVKYVFWHKEKKAMLCMNDGHKVETYSNAEFNVVEDMFGSNRSGRITSF